MEIDLGIETTYEGYKKALVELMEKRKKLERKAKRLATAYRKGDESKYNDIAEQYALIEDVSVFWYKILHMALTDFPEMIDDEDLPRGKQESFQVFKKEEEEIRKRQEETFMEVTNSLVINSKSIGEKKN